MTTTGLPETVRVDDEPIYKNLKCNDGGKREFGRIRVSESVLDELECDYPYDVLATEGMYSSGKNVFALDEYGLLVHETNLSSEEDIYPWHTQWVIAPSECADRTDITDEAILYSPSEGLYIGHCKIEEMSWTVTVWDEDGETVHTCKPGEISVHEVPDEVIRDILPEEYTSDLVSTSI